MWISHQMMRTMMTVIKKLMMMVLLNKKQILIHYPYHANNRLASTRTKELRTLVLLSLSGPSSLPYLTIFWTRSCSSKMHSHALLASQVTTWDLFAHLCFTCNCKMRSSKVSRSWSIPTTTAISSLTGWFHSPLAFCKLVWLLLSSLLTW